MAEKATKGSAAKAAKAPEKHDEHGTAEAVVVEKSAHGDDHGHGHGHDAGHDHKPNRKEYFVIFVALFVLTVLEVIVAQIPGLSKTILALVLVGMAVAKAALVGLYYMHLKHETKVLRLSVAIPLAAPGVYAIVLISEAAWRHL